MNDRLTLLDLEPVLRQLEGPPARIPIGLRGRATIARLIRHHAHWADDPARFARVVAGALAADKQERALIEHRLERWLVRYEPPSLSLQRSPTPPTAGDRSMPPDVHQMPAPPPTRHPRLAWAAAAVTFSVGLAMILAFWGRSPNVGDDALGIAPRPEVSDEAILARCPERPDEVVAQGMYRVPVTKARIEGGPPPSPVDPAPGLVLALMSAALLLVLWAIVVRSTRLPRSDSDRPPEPPEGPMREGEMPALLSADERRRVAAGAGRWTTAMAGRRIDLQRSVMRAVRTLEPCEPLYHRARRERTVWVWRHTRVRDPLAYALAAELKAVLDEHRTPRRLLQGNKLMNPSVVVDGRAEPVVFAELADEAQGAAVVLVTHRAALMSKPGHPRDDVCWAWAELARWPRVLVVDVSRSVEVARLTQAFRLDYAVPEGIARWLERRVAQTRPPPKPAGVAVWQAALTHADGPLGLADRLDLLAALRRSSGDVARRLADVRGLHAAHLLGEMDGAPLDRSATLQARTWQRRRMQVAFRTRTDSGAADEEAVQTYQSEMLQFDLRTRNIIGSGVDDLVPDVVQYIARYGGEAAEGVRSAVRALDDAVMEGSSSWSRAVLQSVAQGRDRTAPPSLARWSAVILLGVLAGAATLGALEWTLRSDAPELGKAVMEMVVLPGGTFCMGSPKTERERLVPENLRSVYDDEGLHLVAIKDFAIGRIEVTVAQYEAWRTATSTPAQAAKSDVLRHPMTEVTWKEARDFCREFGEGLRPTDRSAVGVCGTRGSSNGLCLWR